MRRDRLAAFGLAVLAVGVSLTASEQERRDPMALIAAQRDAMAPLGFMDGVWRGTAWTILPTGQKHVITQTERVGSFLEGAVKVIEGRGYDADGSVVFNAFAVISYNADTRTYSMRSYAQGHAGDYVFTPAPDGYVWEIPAGPVKIRYTAVIRDGEWRQVGERIASDNQATRFFEMNLTRVRDTDWPAGGAVGPR